jgi:NMD protein affecting ribosome stability and mRNA decay
MFRVVRYRCKKCGIEEDAPFFAERVEKKLCLYCYMRKNPGENRSMRR